MLTSARHYASIGKALLDICYSRVLSMSTYVAPSLFPSPSPSVILNDSHVKNRFIIVGLGNHGLSSRSRHSVGFTFVDYVATLLKRYSTDTEIWTYDGRLGASTACFNINLSLLLASNSNGNASASVNDTDGLSIVLVKPRRLMNICGDAVKNVSALCDYEFPKHKKSSTIKKRRSSIDMSLSSSSDIGDTTVHLLVCHDDLDRDFGKISLKLGGSACGHNGVKSVIQSLGTDAFPRVRIGIGRGGDTVDHVLSDFSDLDWTNLSTNILGNGFKIVQNWVVETCQGKVTIENPSKKKQRKM